MIISVSRRCDIPRFAFDWFLERLDSGYAEVKNPFNASQTRRIPLLSPAPERPAGESAELLVFWTRDPASILEHTETLEGQGYCFFVMTTLTLYPPLLEPNVPPAETVIKTMEKLAQKITANRVIWRYDPIFLSSITDFEFHRRNFADLAMRLNGTVKRVIVSVYDEYPAAERRLAALEQSRSSGSGGLKRLTCYENGPNGENSLPAQVLSPAVRQLLAELARIAKRE